MKATALLALYERVADTPDAIARLRRFVLDLAVRGKLVEQDPTDEPASELIMRRSAMEISASRSRRKSKVIAASCDILEGPFDVPATWAWVRMGEIFDYDAGVKREPSTLDPSLWLLELEDIEKETGRLLCRSTVSERDSKSTKSEFAVGDILYGKLRPYLTKVLVADRRGYSTTEIVAIRSRVPMCPEYCALALRRPDFIDYVTRLGQGTKMPRLRTEDAVIAPFPVPPLAEQHRIVSKVDELMALLDRLEAAHSVREATRDRLTIASLTRLTAAERNSEALGAHARFALDALPALTRRADQIKQLRQTILDLAVRGWLIEQQAEEGSAALELPEIQAQKEVLCRDGKFKAFEGTLNRSEDAQPFPIPNGWVWCYLDDIAAIGRGGSPRPIQAFLTNEKDGIPWIKIGDSTRGSIYIDATEERMKPSGLARSRLVIPGDLLLSNSMSFGFPYITRVRGCIHDGWLVIRTPEKLVSKLYLHKFLLSGYASAAFNKAAAGAVVQNLNADKVRQLAVPLPPLAEQHRIVAKVDEVMALCDRLEAALQAVDTIRVRLLEALLHEALGNAMSIVEAA